MSDWRRPRLARLGTVVACCGFALWLGPAASLGNGPEPPANDNYSFPINLNARGQPLVRATTLKSSVDTTHATLQTTDLLQPCGTEQCPKGPPESSSCSGVEYGKTVWYGFYPDHDGQVEIRTKGFPNVIALYSYDPSSLVPTLIQCESGSKYPSNELEANVHSGQAYTFQVGGRNGAGGNLQVLFNYGYQNLPVAPFFIEPTVHQNTPSPNRATLLKVRLIGVARGESISSACVGCGGGLLKLGVRRGNTIVLNSSFPPVLSSQTRMLIAATAPAQVGRYKIYGYNSKLQHLPVLASGCLAPQQTAVNPSDVNHLSLLRPITCPTTLLNPIGAEYVFWRSKNERLWEARYTGRSWTAAVPLNVGRIASPPAVAVHANGEQDVFWEGLKDQLRESWYTGAWNPSINLGGHLASPPTAGVDAAGDEYVFWKGTDGGLWEKVYADQGWSLPISVNIGEIGSGPAVAVHPGGQVDVFWKGLDGQLTEAWCYRRCGEGAQWQTTKIPGGGALGSAPAVAADASGNQYVFWEGTDHLLWSQSYVNGRWARVAQVLNGGLLGSPPSVAVHADGQQDVFWLGQDGRLWETWFTKYWNGPIHLHAQPGSQPAAGIDASGKGAGPT